MNFRATNFLRFFRLFVRSGALGGRRYHIPSNSENFALGGKVARWDFPRKSYGVICVSPLFVVRCVPFSDNSFEHGEAYIRGSLPSAFSTYV